LRIIAGLLKWGVETLQSHSHAYETGRRIYRESVADTIRVAFPGIADLESTSVSRKRGKPVG
jgi:hypothetical protein